MNFDFSEIIRQANLYTRPYVPPCERNPYYDDPRDVKPTSEGWAADISKAMSDYAKNIPFYWSQYSGGCECDMSSDNSVEMTQCKQCGTYFPKRIFTPFDLNVCDECLKKSQEDYRENKAD